MTNKQISQASDLLMRGVFPFHCVFRDQQDQDDVGVDYEVELLNDRDQGEAFIFKIQLKGVEGGVYDKLGGLIYSKASVERFSYYMNKLEIPILFMVGDVINGRCYWCKVQGNKVIQVDLQEAIARKQKTFSVRLLPGKTLSKGADCAALLMEDIESSGDSIAIKKLKNLPVDKFNQYIREDGDAGETAKSLRKLLAVADTEDIRNLIHCGDYNAAGVKARRLLDSESELPETRISAGISLVEAYVGHTRGETAAHRRLDVAKFQLKLAILLIPICRDRRCPEFARTYVICYFRGARMSVNSMVTMGLVVSEITQSESGDPWLRSLTMQQRVEVSVQVVRDCVSIHRLLLRAVRNGQFGLFPYMWIQWVKGLNSFVMAMRLLKRNELADAYVAAVDELLPFCFKVIDSMRDKSEAERLLTVSGNLYLMLSDPSDLNSSSGRLSFIESNLDGMKASAFLDKALSEFKGTVSVIQGSVGEKIEPTMDDLKEHYLIQAAAFGINVDDPDDEDGKVVKMGLEDLDPTRVCRTCKYIHVVAMGGGVIAQQLGLPTAGMKKIICVKHGHASGGWSLDENFKFFSKRMPLGNIPILAKEFCCEVCDDRSPHEENWQWSSDWQKSQAEVLRRNFPNRNNDF